MNDLVELKNKEELNVREFFGSGLSVVHLLFLIQKGEPWDDIIESTTKSGGKDINFTTKSATGN